MASSLANSRRFIVPPMHDGSSLRWHSADDASRVAALRLPANTPGIFGRRALPRGRLVALGAHRSDEPTCWSAKYTRGVPCRRVHGLRAATRFYDRESRRLRDD